MTDRPMVRCACGCGIAIEPADRYGRTRRFVPGHGSAAREAVIDRTLRAAKHLVDTVRVRRNLHELTLLDLESGTIEVRLADIVALAEALEGPR